ncbi:hypothetical protein D1007_57966 [Hordeum vulgare]|nr:hypothetical protein D1007_57966 [Hordeum vulgare]
MYSPDNLSKHEIKQLGNKKHALPRIPQDNHKDVFATSKNNYFEIEVGPRRYWVTKLTNKVKKTFSLQAYLHKNLYDSHVNMKLARRRQIQIMQALNLRTKSGAKKTITPEEKWIYEHITWTNDEASCHPTTASSTPATDDIMEEDEEPNDDDDSEETKQSEEDD